MKLVLCFVLAVAYVGVDCERENCEKCVPKERCDMYGNMDKREQDLWVQEHPCNVTIDDYDTGPLFGFAPMAKGDLVCCPYSNIWGLENPTTTSSTPHNNLGNRFGEYNDERKYRPDSKEFHTDDGYNQDNLHKKQNSNRHRNSHEDNDDDELSYEKQRNPFGPRSKPGNNFGRGPARNHNGPRNQPVIQGGNNNRLPVFGPNGMPILNGQNSNNNNFNRPNMGRSNFNPISAEPIANNRRQCNSILPPDPESGCCGIDLAAERTMARPNYMNRPARNRPATNLPINSNNRAGNSNFGPSNFRPTNPNFGPFNSNFGPGNSNFNPNSNFGPAVSNPWAGPNRASGYPRRFTRETPEDFGISLDDRIAGGKETDLYQFPWTVLLKTTFDYGNKKSTFNCGGSLISSRYVLTAAHCVTEPNSRISNIDVYLAEYDKRTFPRDCIKSPEGRKCIDNILVHAEDVKVHPYYDDDKLQSDIALIRLQENIPYTEYTRPICLPSINVDNPEFTNLRLAVAGWGRNGSVPSDLKQSTVVNLVPQRRCSLSYPSLTNQHVCAAGHTGEDTCKGDSGGPLMMLYEGKYYVSGVVSGKRADAPCGTSVPSLYTNVYHFLPWIRQNIRN